jgi:CDK inhibitor PHO81
MVPALVDAIRELGLVLVMDASNETTELESGTNKAWSQMHEGVNGILKGTGTLRFHDTIDM